jgi:amino acid transporter
MELTEQDVKAIAEVRFKLHKELTWKRKYTVPMYSAMTIGVVLSLFLANFVRSIQPHIAIFDIALWVFAYIVWINWRNHIKRPWMKKFIEYYQEHKDFMQ